MEYRISDVGRTLQDLIDPLLLWTTTHLTEVDNARKRFDAERDT